VFAPPHDLGQPLTFLITQSTCPNRFCHPMASLSTAIWSLSTLRPTSPAITDADRRVTKPRERSWSPH
jgi:hypothetical protein